MIRATQGAGYVSLVRVGIILIALCAIVFQPSTLRAADRACPENIVSEGIADLRCWTGTEPVSLKGQWGLEYQADRQSERFNGLALVPGLWRDMSPALPFSGRGVYAVSIQLEKPMEQLGLKLPLSNMARKVVLTNPDGKEFVVFDSGNTGSNMPSIAAMRMPIIALPKVESGSELTLIVSNSFSVHGGLEDDVWLGPLDVLSRDELILVIYAAMITTILMVFFIVNSGLWISGDRDSVLVMLGIIAALSAYRQALVSGLLFDVFPSLTNQFEAVTGWLSFFGVAMAGVYYFRFNYPNLVPQWLANGAVGVAIVGLIILVFQPLHIAQQFGAIYRPVLSIFMIILLGYLWTGFRHPSRELKFTLAGSSIAVAAMIIDIMYYQIIEYHPVVSISSLGFLVFMATETFMMTQRYSHSIRTSENLAAELRALNASLEYKIDERTVELAAVNERLVSMANTDALTGLANRRAFDEAVKREEARSKRSGRNLVVGLVDLCEQQTYIAAGVAMNFRSCSQRHQGPLPLWFQSACERPLHKRNLLLKPALSQGP